MAWSLRCMVCMWGTGCVATQRLEREAHDGGDDITTCLVCMVYFLVFIWKTMCMGYRYLERGAQGLAPKVSNGSMEREAHGSNDADGIAATEPKCSDMWPCHRAAAKVQIKCMSGQRHQKQSGSNGNDGSAATESKCSDVWPRHRAAAKVQMKCTSGQQHLQQSMACVECPEGEVETHTRGKAVCGPPVPAWASRAHVGEGHTRTPRPCTGVPAMKAMKDMKA